MNVIMCFVNDFFYVESLWEKEKEWLLYNEKINGNVKLKDNKWIYLNNYY